MQDKSGIIDTWVPSVVGYQIFKKGLSLNLLKYIIKIAQYNKTANFIKEMDSLNNTEPPYFLLFMASYS